MLRPSSGSPSKGQASIQENLECACTPVLRREEQRNGERLLFDGKPAGFSASPSQKSFKAIVRERRQHSIQDGGRSFDSHVAEQSVNRVLRLRGNQNKPEVTRSRTLPVEEPSDSFMARGFSDSVDLNSAPTFTSATPPSSPGCRGDSSDTWQHMVRRPSEQMRLQQSAKVGWAGQWRTMHNDRADLFTQHSFQPHVLPGVDEGQSRFTMVVAFVARRVYKRLREHRARPRASPLMESFNEENFLSPDIRFMRSAMSSRCCCFFRRRAAEVKINEVFDFIFNFASWCAMPPDLLIVALVYLDRLLKVDRCHGTLSSESWRPIMVASLVLASKVWEDYCICNFEAAHFAKYTLESFLRLELLLLDALSWNANISAELFAPYFWAAERDIEEGRDEQLTASRTLLNETPLSAAAADPLDVSSLSICSRQSSQSWHAGVAGVAGVGRHHSAPFFKAPEASKDRASSSDSFDVLGSSPPQLPFDGGMLFDEFEKHSAVSERSVQNSIVFVPRFDERYKVHGVLGRGAFAVVYLVARQDDPESRFAMKVYSRANTARYRVESFILSGVASSLRHPNIVKYIEFIVDESRSHKAVAVLPVMEALTGPDLFDWFLDRQKQQAAGQCQWISEREAANIIKQTLCGLSYIHNRRPCIVHQDIKAENLRWASNEIGATLKVVDFGLCYVDGFSNALAGRKVGTPLYLSPEMLSGCVAGKPQPSLDMYSVGVVLFLLLSSQFPFSETDSRGEPPAMDSASWFRVSHSASTLTTRLLSQDPSDRPSAEQALFAAWFEDAESAKPGGALAAPLPCPTSDLNALRERSSLSSIAFRLTCNLDEF